jgi:amino acid adenylation domain-containing protein
VLRTTFADHDGTPVQVVAPFGGFALPVEDLSGSSEADREAEVRRRAGAEVARVFDLSRGPLFRAALLRLDAEDHVLLLSMHHVVSDAWSMGVFFRELSALYAAYGDGGESPLAELAVQYADYAVWQREQLEGEVLERQLSYWKEQLAGAPELLELPTDHPRPPVRTYRGAGVPMELSLELLERLQRLGRSEGATLYMTLLGAFQVLLSKYAGSEDVVVGSPIAGRTRGEVEALIGIFLNTLVLRTDLSGDPSFREVLRRVRGVTLGAYEHQDMPFEKLVAELQPERSLSHAPLFQAMFTLQNARDLGGDLPGLKVGGVDAAIGIARFDLALTLTATAQGLRGGLNYSTDLFERGTVERMLGHLERVLEQVAADADVRLSRLDLLGEAERALVLEEWNRAEAEVPTDRCIHQLFEAQAGRTPGAVAVVHRGERLTYAELNARANRLAHHLRARGVGPDMRVGVCVERGVEMMVGLLGVLKAGGAYVPLDPAYPVERLRYMLENSAPVMLLTEPSLEGLFEGSDVPMVDLSAPAPEWADRPESNPDRGDVGLGPDDLAYVIYTSGSTGLPKGVMVGHGGVVNLLASMRGKVAMDAGDRVLSVTTIAFDIAALELFLPLSCGASTVILGRSAAADPALLAAAISDHDATVLQATPATWRMLVEGGWEGRQGLRALCGGEALGTALAAEVRGRVGELWNVYGPTETTIWSSAERVGEASLRGRAHAPIGRPLSNTQIYLLDASGQPVPVGVAGELYIGGAGVTRGYRGRPGHTAERFVPDPFGRKPGARLYRTGDLGRWLPDGAIEFMGRNDAQVKVRGFRVELGEIEARLAEHAAVRQAVVVAREDVPGDRRLVAYLVGGVETDTLRAHLRRSLPEYMVPAAFVVLEAMPLTPNGKVDRKALPAPDLASAEGEYVTPRTPVEEVLAEIWAEVLRLERVGVHESFFELGGHSLMAIRVISRVRAVFGVELPLRVLFEGPTIAELAVRVEEIRRAGLPVLPPVVPTERTDALPLSFAQERLWFIDRLEPGSTAYNIPVALRLGGALDEAALERALGEIVRRHEALRTTFKEVDGSPVQVIAPFGGFALPVEDLSGLSDADRDVAVRRRAGEEAGRVFDLAAGSLFRATLLRLGDEEHVLLLSMHHIVSDVWSIGVLLRELSSLYAAYSEGGESPLPELPVQYADYSVWQREQLEGEVLDRQLSYWREQLAGAPELLELPTDHPRPAVQSYRGTREGVELPGELLERLRAVGRQEGATLYMVLLGAFQVLLSRYSGIEDIVVGSPIAGRTRREVEELIGFFVNTLVLRTDLSGDPGFREVLRRVREAALGAYAHQELPFERLVAELQPERSLSHSPLFQVLFTLQNAGDAGANIPGMRTEGVESVVSTTQFDLHLAFVEGPRGLRAVLRYSTDLFERSTIVRMLGHLEQVLEEVAGNAELRLSQLQVMGAAERRRVLEEWNGTEAGYPADLCSHELFEAQVERTPDAVAAVYEGEALSYAELNARANRLAHALREHGRGPGRAGGDLRGARPGDAGGAAGHPQGGGRLRTARPRVSGGPPALHAGGQRSAGAADVRRARGAVRGEPGDGHRPRRGGRVVGQPSAVEPGPRGAHPRPPVLRDLHLRVDGPAQGSGDAAPPAREPGGVAGAGARAAAGGGHAPVHHHQLRRLVPGDLHHPGHGGAAGRRLGRRAARSLGHPGSGRAGGGGAALPAVLHAAARRRAGGGARPGALVPAGGADGGRGAADHRADPPVVRGARGPAPQPLRAVGDARRHLLLPPGSRGRLAPPSLHRGPGREHAGLRPGRAPGPGSRGSAGRAVPGRGLRRARVPGPSGSHGGALRRRSLLP